MSRTILIIEDEHILREIMKDYLLAEGYEVLEAADGKLGIALFQEHEVDLIILDIMLPELDGWSVCKRIRKTSNVPIIMLTAARTKTIRSSASSSALMTMSRSHTVLLFCLHARSGYWNAGLLTIMIKTR